MSLSLRQPTRSEIVYPDDDGEPMSDNTLQWQWIVTIKEGLEQLFRADPNVFVAGNLLWYPVEGDPLTRAAPDAMVAFGRPKGYRGSYKQWIEGGIAPQVVFEVLSPGNRTAELERKFQFYQRFGVEEYYQYDPDEVILRAWRRSGDQLVELPSPSGIVSLRLGVQFELPDDQRELRIIRPDGEAFLTVAETNLDRDALRAERDVIVQERDRLAQERDRSAQERDAAQLRLERLAAQLRAAGIDPDD
jgi:Uma2 family endonuclease